MGKKSDGDGCVKEGKERKTEAEVDGQHQEQVDTEGIIRQRGPRPGYLETTISKYRSNIIVEKHADEEEDWGTVNWK